jgi:Ca2+-binding EF-hand superfamily protein
MVCCWQISKQSDCSFLLGRIEFEEFAEIVADSYFKKFTRAEILEAFTRFDRNRDGFIEADELKNILSQLGRNYSNEEVRLNDQKCFFIQYTF